MRLLYTFAIFLYGVLLRMAAPFHPKAKLMVSGRKNWAKKLQKSIPKNALVYWFHCASLGEFEQGRPLLEALKKKHPNYFILLSFFSPSGYEVRKNYDGADYVCYLPLDTPRNARRFIELIQPQSAFFIKYEFWANSVEPMIESCTLRCP